MSKNNNNNPENSDNIVDVIQMFQEASVNPTEIEEDPKDTPEEEEDDDGNPNPNQKNPPKSDDDDEDNDEEDEDDDEDEDDEPSDTKELLVSSGYLSEDEISEDDDPVDLIDKAVSKQLEESLKALPPEVKGLVKHVMNGGDFNEYFKAIKTASDVDFDKVGEDEQETEKAIREYFSLRGLEPDEIDEQIDVYKETGKLLNKGTAIAEKLKNLKEKKKAEVLKQSELQKQKREQEINNTVNELKRHLKDVKEIDGVNFTDEEVELIPTYLYKPKIKVGNVKVSEFQRDLYKIMLDKEKSAVLAKMVKNGLDMTEISRQIEDKILKDLKNDTRRVRKSGKRRKKQKPLWDLI